MTTSILALVSGIAAILASRRSKNLAFYITKPLTTSLILLPVLALLFTRPDLYTALILAGLAFALAGDILLMLPERYFPLGIGSFALTHLLYFAAFVLATGLALGNPSALVLFAYAALMLRYLWPGVRASLRPAVAIYVLLITGMTVQAIGSALSLELFVLAALGSLFFLASDSILAVDRFRTPFAAARPLVLSTYWLGQWLIALSARAV